MKRVAIPILEEKLSEYFGQCSHYEIFEIDGQKISRHNIDMAPDKHRGDLPEWTLSKGITDIIVHKVDKQIISRFLANKINLFVGVEINSPQLLIEDYLNGKLTSNKNIIKEITN